MHFLEYHRHRRANLVKAASCVLSSLLIFHTPSQAALLGETPLEMTIGKDSQAETLQTSASVAVHKGTGMYFPYVPPLLTHWTFTPFSFTAYFQEQLISLSRKPSQRADSGLASQLPCTFPSHEILHTFHEPPEILGVRSYSFHTSNFLPSLAALVQQLHDAIPLLGTSLKSSS